MTSLKCSQDGCFLRIHCQEEHWHGSKAFRPQGLHLSSFEETLYPLLKILVLFFGASQTANDDSRVELGYSIYARWTSGMTGCQIQGRCSGLSITDLGPADGYTNFQPVSDSTWSRIHLE